LREALERTSKTVGGGVRRLAMVSGAILLCLMVLTVVAVVLRKMNDPIMGVQDLSESGLTLVVFFAMAYSGWTGGHIAIDLIGSALSPGALRRVDAVTRFLSAVFFLLVAWQSGVQGMDALEFGDGFNLLDIPHYPFFFIISFGFVLYSIVLFILAVRTALGLPEPEKL